MQSVISTPCSLARPSALRAAPSRLSVARRSRYLAPRSSTGDESQPSPDAAGPSTSGSSFADQQRQQQQLKGVPYRAIGALAAVGLVETTYLTAAKLAHVDVVCPLSGGCAEILSSDYSNLLGLIPVSALGMAAYGGMAMLCLAGTRARPAQQQQQQQHPAAARHEDAAAAAAAAEDAEDMRVGLRTGVLAASVAMASCSSYLMWVMLSQFSGELCPWCIASAGLSFAIFGLAASGLRRRELEEAAGPGLGLVAACVLALSLTLGTPGSAESRAITELPYRLPEVTTASDERAVALAKRLRDAGAKMYGAFWCSHCFEQKETFGAEAMAAFPYVECYPNGWKKDEPMAAACKEAGLEGFPTWVVGDQRLIGEQSFEKLEAALQAVGK